MAILVLPLMMTSCTKAKKELAVKIIDSYSQAVREEDELMMLKLFPDIKYFDEYPKVDKIVINEMQVDKDNVISLCTLFYETGLGKQIEQEIKFLISTKDSSIANVEGFLTRKDRNSILESNIFEIFPELKPSESDMDVNFVKNQTIAVNRRFAYEYYATKTLGEKTKVDLDVSFNKYSKYGILTYYNKVKITLSITNNSDDTCRYSYNDNNFEYHYSFPKFSKTVDTSSGSSGYFILGPSETIYQEFIFKGEFMYPLDKSDIKIKPVFESINDAIKIVDKYCTEAEKQVILSGEENLWDETYEYSIEF